MHRGAEILPGAAVLLVPGDVKPWGGTDAESLYLAPGRAGRVYVLGSGPLNSWKGPTGRRKGDDNGHDQDAGE